jgi:hypothetical protein
LNVATPERRKIYALGVLAAIAFVAALLEAAVTGHVDPFSKFGLAETFVSLLPIYYWYYVDKAQRQFHASPVLNVGVVALAVIAIPVYFIRSRGWKRGGISIAWAIGVLAMLFGLEYIGEAIGTAITS